MDRSFDVQGLARHKLCIKKLVTGAWHVKVTLGLKEVRILLQNALLGSIQSWFF